MSVLSEATRAACIVEYDFIKQIKIIISFPLIHNVVYERKSHMLRDARCLYLSDY